jgi:hypothetical protein
MGYVAHRLRGARFRRDWHQSARPRHATFLGIVRQVKVRGASLKAPEQPIDTATAAGKCFSTCWASSLNFGTDPRGGRLEGIAEAKGVYRAGRPRAMQTQYEK